MKKLLILGLLAALLTAPSIFATDVSVVYNDTMISTDTNATRTDTAVTTSFRIRDYGRIWLTVTIDGYANDTSFANDSYFVFFQHSFNDIDWTLLTFATDTLQKILKGANDTDVVIATSINRDSVHVGNYGRVMFCHRCALSEADINGNAYRKRLSAWFNVVK